MKIFEILENILQLTDHKITGISFIYLIDDWIIVDPMRDSNEQILIYIKENHFKIEKAESYPGAIKFDKNNKPYISYGPGTKTALPHWLFYKVYYGKRIDSNRNISRIKEEFMKNKKKMEVELLMINFDQGDCRIFCNI